MKVLRTLAWRKLRRLRSWQQFILDERRYQRWSVPTDLDSLKTISGRQLECQVTKDYHRIEKGLAFVDPKRPFGADAQMRLELAMHGRSWNGDEAYVGYAERALSALDAWNAGGDVDEVAAPRAVSLGSANIPEEEVDALFSTRRSVRAFDTTRSPKISAITRAVRLAINTPSVCNRQAWKAHYFEGDAAQKILSHQRGNRGFGHTVPGVLIVTVDTRMFSGSGERNQRWIDGGLFSMSLVWALHATGLSSCMLNWSRTNRDSDQLRQAANLREWEDVVVLIAVGYPVPEHRVARSQRRQTEDVLVLHPADLSEDS